MANIACFGHLALAAIQIRVKMATVIPTSKTVAIKLFKAQSPFENNQISSFLNEVNSLTILNSPNIIKINDFKVNGLLVKSNGAKRYVLYYVMELADNGQIFQLVQISQAFNQKLSRHYFRQIINAIDNMHKKGIAHRDIKTQNILFDKNYIIKIVDFGFSCICKDEKGDKVPMELKAVGTMKTNAPEIVNGLKQKVYPEGLDLFSVGCVLFQMRMGSVPFKSSLYQDEYYSKLISLNKNSFWKVFSGICEPSSEFKDLVQQLLQPQPNKRMTLSQLFQHPWVLGQLPTQNQISKEMAHRFKKINPMLKSQREAYIRNKIAKSKMVYEFVPSNISETEICKELQQKILRLSKSFSQKRQQSEGSNSSKEDKDC